MRRDEKQKWAANEWTNNNSRSATTSREWKTCQYLSYLSVIWWVMWVCMWVCVCPFVCSSIHPSINQSMSISTPLRSKCVLYIIELDRWTNDENESEKLKMENPEENVRFPLAPNISFGNQWYQIDTFVPTTSLNHDVHISSHRFSSSRLCSYLFFFCFIIKCVDNKIFPEFIDVRTTYTTYQWMRANGNLFRLVVVVVFFSSLFLSANVSTMSIVNV